MKIVTKPVYIKPRCEDCKYYLRKSALPTLNECMRFTWETLNNKQVNEYAELCRKDETKCGEWAYYFTPK
jgi:hypothetical protein